MFPVNFLPLFAMMNPMTKRILTAFFWAAAGLSLASLPLSKAEAHPDSATASETKGWLGVQMERRNTTDVVGVAIQRAVPGSPAEAAKLQRGDVIQRVNAHDVRTPADLSQQIAKVRAGETVVLDIGGKNARSVTVTLTAPPQNPADLAGQLIGRPAPSTHALNATSGSKEAVTPRDGKVRIVELWATWCGPCRIIQPLVSRQVDSMDSERFEFVGVAEDDTAAVRKYLARYPANYRVLIDPENHVGDAYWSTATPTFVLIGADGKIVAHRSGIDGVDALFEQARALVRAAQK